MHCQSLLVTWKVLSQLRTRCLLVFSQQQSTGMTGAELYDLLAGARPDQGRWQKALQVYSACRSKAQWPLEQFSIEMIGTVLNDRLVGARLYSRGHRSKARPCLPEQGSTAPGARLYRDDRSSAIRSPSWIKAQQLRAQEQVSTVPAGAGLNDTWSKALQG